MIAPRASTHADILVTIFGRLFESELSTLEQLTVSCRTPDGVRSLGERTALALLLGEDPPADAPAAAEPGDGAGPSTTALHRTMLGAWPETTAAVSGLALHLRDLLTEGLPLPDPTSMMRKRGVTQLADHLVEPAALAPAELDRTLARARETAVAKGMKHVLIVVSDGTVHVAGRTPEETMAHWSNVEFSAKVECLRVEERATSSHG